MTPEIVFMIRGKRNMTFSDKDPLPTPMGLLFKKSVKITLARDPPASQHNAGHYPVGFLTRAFQKPDIQH